MNAKTAAAEIGVSVATVYTLIKKGVLRKDENGDINAKDVFDEAEKRAGKEESIIAPVEMPESSMNFQAPTMQVLNPEPVKSANEEMLETIRLGNRHTETILNSITSPLKQINDGNAQILKSQQRTIEQQFERIQFLEAEQTKHLETMRALALQEHELEQEKEDLKADRERKTLILQQLAPFLPDLAGQVLGKKKPKLEVVKDSSFSPEASEAELGHELAKALSIEQCQQLAELAKFQDALRLEEILQALAAVKEIQAAEADFKNAESSK